MAQGMYGLELLSKALWDLRGMRENKREAETQRTFMAGESEKDRAASERNREDQQAFQTSVMDRQQAEQRQSEADAVEAFLSIYDPGTPAPGFGGMLSGMARETPAGSEGFRDQILGGLGLTMADVPNPPKYAPGSESYQMLDPYLQGQVQSMEGMSPGAQFCAAQDIGGRAGGRLSRAYRNKKKPSGWRNSNRCLFLNYRIRIMIWAMLYT